MNRSPLPTDEVSPVRAIPIDARSASARSCRLSSGASVATTMMMLPLPSRPCRARALGVDRPQFACQPLADRDADDGELRAGCSGVVVDQHADAIAALVAAGSARRRADAGFEAERVHARPGADAAARELSRASRSRAAERRRSR